MRVQKLRIAHVRFAPGVVPISIYTTSHQGVAVAYADQSEVNVNYVLILVLGVTVMSTVDRKNAWVMSDMIFPHSQIFKENKVSRH